MLSSFCREIAGVTGLKPDWGPCRFADDCAHARWAHIPATRSRVAVGEVPLLLLLLQTRSSSRRRRICSLQKLRVVHSRNRPSLDASAEFTRKRKRRNHLVGPSAGRARFAGSAGGLWLGLRGGPVDAGRWGALDLAGGGRGRCHAHGRGLPRSGRHHLEGLQTWPRHMRSDTSREPTRGRAPRGASPRPARAALHHRPIPA